MHRLWTLSKVIIKLQFKQIIIAEIKLDICIGYKPFISKAVGNVFIKIAYQLIELNQKGYHWQNLGTILRNVIACEFWCAYRLRGFARSTTPGAWNVDALICNQHGTEILEIHKCSTTLWRIWNSGNKIPIRRIQPKNAFLRSISMRCLAKLKHCANLMVIGHDTYLNSIGWVLSEIPKTNIHMCK